MLTEKVLKYLKKNADVTLPAYQKKYEENLKELGFNKRFYEGDIGIV